MVENKYLNAIENLTLIEEDKALNQIEKETDRFFNWILKLLFNKIYDEKCNEYIFTIYEDYKISDEEFVYLICEDNVYISNINIYDFYKVVEKIEQIFFTNRIINNLTLFIKVNIYISGIVIVITMIK